ncbi:MBL fold metallo-hydrolase [Granulicella cerasi]|uniref:MBL fold metallo-hydrolase n=1 Tax=Granulicella cerasi TaxID=741063 RepID=A0ABW1Z7I5_9BACT|nr:MBL fold metallo-hydrolase [Granulicella cerasi]
MIRETFPVGLLGCNCTILGDETSREAIVIDPGSEVPRIVALLKKHELTVKRIVITHAHIDHIASAQSLKQITGAPIFYNKQDLPLVALMSAQAKWLGIAEPTVLPPDHSPLHQETISINGIDATVLHTPGHTEGSLCLLIPAENLLIAGDTLFAGSIGRTDLPGGSAPVLLESIREQLLPLPGETVVVPGHGAETTIEQEGRTNPFLVTDPTNRFGILP